MADPVKSPASKKRNSQEDGDSKFDPSDYLPRRTSRASAQAATEAIKKNVKEEKTNPNKLSAPDNTKDKPKDASLPKSNTVKTATSKIAVVKKKTAMKRKRPAKEDCFVKLVRCEEDPRLRSLVSAVKRKHKMASHKIGTVNMSIVRPDLKTANSSAGSKYEIVYAPTYHSEAVGHNHIVRSGPKTLPNKLQYAPTYASESDLKLKPNYSGSKVRQANPEFGTNASGGSKSLSLVVVHPKPGATIVNANRGKESKSHVLQQMMSDPSLVLSNNVSRVTAGLPILQCNVCSQTFSNTRDVATHKKLAHNCKNFMCITCNEEFPSLEAQLAHVCPAKFRCDICGILCKKEQGLINHKRMAHANQLRPFMCFKCCYTGTSQHELDTHLCGGRPLVTPIRGKTAPASFMVYPPMGKGMGLNANPTAAGKNSNIYINLSAPSGHNNLTASSTSESGQYLCEVCLQMFSSESALGSHKCGQPSSANAVTAAPKSSAPQAPLPLEVLPEVEQLAKFYTSMVFKE